MKAETFRLTFQENYFKKNDILVTNEGYRLKVIKIYKYNLWKKFLHFMGFKIKIFKGIKVKTI